jgi:hypothetical protein
MRTTLNISKELLDQAMAMTGARTKTEVIDRALRLLIREQRVEALLSRRGRLRFADSDELDEARHAR